MIPALVRKMLESRDEVVLWGDGSPTREFLYVDDAAEGFVLAAERYDGAEPVNLGTGVEISIRELAETIAELTGFEGEIVWDATMPNGQPRRSLDASKAERLFGFRARTPLRDGLARTVAWYREQRGRACRLTREGGALRGAIDAGLALPWGAARGARSGEPRRG